MKFGFRLPEVVKNPGSFYLAFSPSSAFGICIHSSLPYSLSLLPPPHTTFTYIIGQTWTQPAKELERHPLLCVYVWPGGPLLRKKGKME